MVLIRPLKIEAKIITSLAGQALGFMFHPLSKKAKLFKFNQEQQIGIHMLFVFFPLIVVWLNKKKKVKYFKVMRPFISFGAHEAKYILEIPYSTKVLRKIKLNKSFSW